MRLIDADKFKQRINAMTIRKNLVPEKCNAICELIYRQPTAYDVEAVLDQIDELNENEFCYSNVVRIIKAGGLN